MRIGMLLRKAVDPIRAVLKETNGFRLFEGVVDKIERDKGWLYMDKHCA